MSTQTKSSSLQTYQLVLYNKALHPEHFSLCDRRVIEHDGYELEAWIMAGSHMLRFEHGELCASELVTDRDGDLPDTDVLTAFFCAGEHEYDHRFRMNRVGYMTTVQTEMLSENLYLATFDEMVAFAAEAGALVHRWDTGAGPCLSVLDLQRYYKEVHAQSYHLLAEGGLVLRTQTIFEHE